MRKERALKSHIYLHSSFRQVATQCQLLSRVNIRIVRLLKNALHLLELKGREGCSISTLLTLGGRIIAFTLHLHTRLRAGRKLCWSSNRRRKFPCWSNWYTIDKNIIKWGKHTAQVIHQLLDNHNSFAYACQFPDINTILENEIKFWHYQLGTECSLKENVVSLNRSSRNSLVGN